MNVILTPAIEDYIKAIYEISKERKVVRIKNIADKLNVKMPSVVNAIKLLSEKKLIVHESYGYIELTILGKETGKEIYDRHIALYKFLYNVLQMDEKIADNDAHAIEHYLDEKTINRIVKFLDFIQNSPNGQPKWIEKFKKFLKTGKKECGA